MNQPSPIITPACAAVEPLLPLVAHELLDADRAAEVRAHLATCQHCQREMALHARVDATLRREFAAPVGAIAPLSRHELAALVSGSASATAPRAPRPPQRRSRLPLFAGIPAVAAVLLIALFAGYIFRTAAGRRTTGATGSPLGANSTLVSIAPVSADEWWGAGYSWNPHFSSPGLILAPTPGVTYVYPIIAHGVGGRITLAPLPQPLVKNAYGVELRGIAMVSPTEGWAVGNTVLPPNADGITTGVLLHYSGGRWTLANGLLGSQLNAITMRTATDGWIAGFDAQGNTLVLHFNGIAVAAVDDPALTHLYVHQIAMSAPDDVWVAGYYVRDIELAAIVHFDGTHWSAQNVPVPNAVITSIAMASADEGWAIAGLPSEQPPGADVAENKMASISVLRYQHGVWEQQATFARPAHTPYFDVTALAMRSASDGWAVGSQGSLFHYAGGVWRETPDPTTRDIYSVALAGTSGGWAVGDQGTVLRLVDGHWTVISGT